MERASLRPSGLGRITAPAYRVRGCWPALPSGYLTDVKVRKTSRRGSFLPGLTTSSLRFNPDSLVIEAVSSARHKPRIGRARGHGLDLTPWSPHAEGMPSGPPLDENRPSSRSSGRG